MIDLDHLARQTAGDSELAHELLTLFLKQLDAFEGQVVATGNPEHGDTADRLAVSLHRIRGAAAAVGASDFATALAHAETALKDGSNPGPVLTALHRRVIAARVELSSLIAARGRPGLAKVGESR